MNKKFLAIFWKLTLTLVLLFVIGKVGSYIKVTNSEAFEIVKQELPKNQKLISRIGKIKGFGFAYGSIKKYEAQVKTTIETEFTIIKILILLERNKEHSWKIQDFKILE